MCRMYLGFVLALAACHARTLSLPDTHAEDMQTETLPIEGAAGEQIDDVTPPAPTVVITTPVASETPLERVVTLAAAVTDAAAVVFLLDGAPLAAELAAAPFSLDWDSRSADNGAHTLTAVARALSSSRRFSSTLRFSSASRACSAASSLALRACSASCRASISRATAAACISVACWASRTASARACAASVASCLSTRYSCTPRATVDPSSSTPAITAISVP